MVANFSNMKRRNADCGRPRRPLKRTKIAEGLYSSTFLYLKFLGIWATVLLFDFLLEFRFEYLWPVWLLFRSIYDSYKYQGLAFSIFFVFIAFTSDMICLLFIPVHWLFFVASTYVWVQLVWHTDRGVCLPTASLWLLFVYIEASVRLRELRTALPFHLDLCRPFAAHCIGYPVVTLGFGFKSYVGYRLRLRKQKEVQKENEFYMQLLQQALPQDLQRTSANGIIEKGKALTHKCEEPVSNGSTKKSSPNGHIPKFFDSSPTDGRSHGAKDTSKDGGGGGGGNRHHSKNNGTNNSGGGGAGGKSYPSLLDPKLAQRIVNHHDGTRENLANEQTQAKHLRQNSSSSGGGGGGGCPSSSSSSSSSKSKNSYPRDGGGDRSSSSSSSSSSSAATVNQGSGGAGRGDRSSSSSSSSSSSAATVNQGSGGAGRKGNRSLPSKVENKDKDTNITADIYHNGSQQQQPPPALSQPFKDEIVISRLESDVKKLKADLQSSRQTEIDLRREINRLVVDEQKSNSDQEQLQRENEALQSKLHMLVTQKQQDKQNLMKMEQRFKQERDARSTVESQLREERKNRKIEEAATRAMLAAANPSRVVECSETCRMKQRDQENEINRLVKEARGTQEKNCYLERQLLQLQERQETQNHNDRLMSNLMALQEKNSKLEASLSAETRLKMDLFSALGDARRQLEIVEGRLMKKEEEIHDLKSKIVDIMSVMPHPVTYQSPTMAPLPASMVPSMGVPRYSLNFCVPTPVAAATASAEVPTSPGGGEPRQPAGPAESRLDGRCSPPGQGGKSGLDPNAAIYRPKSN